MKLRIIAVGHKLPAWAADGCADYVKRMPRDLPLTVTEIKPEPRGSKTREQLLAAEKNRIYAHAAFEASPRRIVLDERGVDVTTVDLANRLKNWQQESGDTVFIIGSADGLDEEIKATAREKIRLSSLTLPHAMARLILCEQLYRAMSIIKNHPYHREG